MPAFQIISLSRTLLAVVGASLAVVASVPGTAAAAIIAQNGTRITITAAPGLASNALLSIDPTSCTGTSCTHATATFSDSVDPITTGTVTDPATGTTSPLPLPPSCSARGGSISCDLGISAATRQISWNFGDGDDLVTVSSTSANVDTWTNNAVSLAMGNGNDRVTGNSSLVSERGDSGDDTFTSPTEQLGSNTIDGGKGYDALSFFLRSGPVVVTSTTYSGAGTYSTMERILGSQYDDVISMAGKIEGEAGNDELHELAGGWSVLGGDGNDQLYGYGANSTLMGEGGDDMLFGGNGADIEHGGDGNDHIYWTSGDDTIFGDSGNDTYDASNAIDPVFICLDNSAAVCGSAYDGLNNEQDQVGSDIEQAIGSPKADILIGSPSSTQLVGLGGDDTFVHIPGPVSSGTEQVVGGPGLDYAMVHTDQAIDFTRDGLTGPAGMQNLQVDADTEFFIGATGGDVYSGGPGNDFFDGQQGDDLISGGDGHDELYGDLGNDTIRGGKGPDYIEGGPGNDNIDGGPARDVILAGDGADVIKARDHQRDSIVCGNGKDTVIADRTDKLTGCEKIKLPRRRRRHRH